MPVLQGLQSPQGSIGKDWYIMEMEWGYVGAVVISGLVIVFVALILLIFMVWLMGKIFEAIKANKQTETENAAKAANAASDPVSTAAAGADEDEVIAVISAAVAMMARESGTALQIKSITPVRKKPARNAWAAAAAAESTRSF